MILDPHVHPREEQANGDSPTCQDGKPESKRSRNGAFLRIKKHAGQEIRVLVRLSPKESQFRCVLAYDGWNTHFDDHEVCLDITGGEDYIYE